ncbi:MAG TPA: DMT family transporter [Candidatus Thioglobus sp.]|jgi:drug/metabolite transporter (DMT)-like permease|nr:DMT family transporter [Candidatus Thioglobus sp.]
MKLHTKWILITILSVVILSPDSLLVRLADSNSWTLVFWRGIGFGIGVLLYLITVNSKGLVSDFSRIGHVGLFVALFFGINSVTFVLALEYTTIANTLIIISSAPIITAILGWFVLGERVSMPTIIAMLIVLLGIYLVMYENFGSLNIKGDLLALSTAIFMSISFILIRKYKSVSMVPAMSIGGFLSAILAFQFAPSLIVSSGAFWYVVAMCGVVTVSFTLITIAPRYIPAAEVGMIMPLETVLASLLAWLIINEEPSSNAIIGGAVVILTLIVHSWYSAKSKR